MSNNQTWNKFRAAITSAKYDPISTGMNSIDKALSGGMIRQTLVIVGAHPGAGKTTLLQQISESVAERGMHVRFINLEMAVEQLQARSLSRLIADKNLYTGNDDIDLTALGILRSRDMYTTAPEKAEIIDRAIDEFDKRCGDRMTYFCPQESNDIDYLIKELEKTLKEQSTPIDVLVVDYLQLLSKDGVSDPVVTMKCIVIALKRFAIEHNCVVIAITANNRNSNQSGKADLYSGRDSSGLEYTADQYAQLVYTAVEEKIDGMTRTLTIDEVESARADKTSPYHAIANRVTFKVVKNRFGETGSAYLTLDGAHSRVTEYIEPDKGTDVTSKYSKPKRQH